MNAFGLATLLIFILAFLSWRTQKLTASGALTGALLATVLFWGGGWLLLAQLGLFFGVGVMVSRFRRGWKARHGLSDTEGELRSYPNVLANAAVASMCALASKWFPSHQIVFQAAALASLGAALSDTCSSELGNVWGRRFWNIRSLQADQRGRDGVISAEGTLVGLIAAFLPALLAFAFDIRAWSWLLLIAFSGFLGNLTDSLLGATFERKGKLGNHAVNFLNTLTAAVSVLLFGALVW